MSHIDNIDSLSVSPLSSAESEDGLLGRPQHRAQAGVDQDRRHLPRPGADQRVRAEGSQGGDQIIPANSRNG